MDDFDGYTKYKYEPYKAPQPAPVVPPQRQWVGLTDEEQQHFRKLGFVGVEQVEAKLREKNGIKGEA